MGVPNVSEPKPFVWVLGDRLAVVGVLPDSVEFCALTKTALDELKPSVVAVELPTESEKAALLAGRRLPKASILIPGRGTVRERARIVHVGDPTAEALRWAVQHGATLVCVEPQGAPPWVGAVPDPWLVWPMGLGGYRELLLRLGGMPPEAVERAGPLAEAISKVLAELAAGGGRVVAVLSLPVAIRIARVGLPKPAPVLRPRGSWGVASVKAGHMAAVSALPAAGACWHLIREGELPAAGEEPSIPAPGPQRASALFDFAFSVGRKPILRLLRGMASRDSFQMEMEVLRWLALGCCAEHPELGPLPDIKRLGRLVFSGGARRFEAWSGRKVEPWQWRAFGRFLRRYQLLSARVVPMLYELVECARGVGGDTLGWHVYLVGACYPWQEQAQDLPSLPVDDSWVRLGVKRIRFRRNSFRVKGVPLPVGTRLGAPSEWVAGCLEGASIWSYPPEDRLVEGFADRLRMRQPASTTGVEVSSPFTVGLEEGLDFRETLRRFWEDRVWVISRASRWSRASSVVVIFDEDDEPYPYTLTWLGEHQNESDMAFYSTDPREEVVAPGIMRARYGGFLLVYPPRRLADVWSDPDYQQRNRKADVLLAAGIDYSMERPVFLVRGRKPTLEEEALATRSGKRIIHVPIGIYPVNLLERLRTVHILVDRSLRRKASRILGRF